MLLTGFAGAVTYNGQGFSGQGDYTLKLPSDVERFKTLAEPVEQAVRTFLDWSVDISIEGSLPARSYGVVSCANWAGVFMKEWGAELTAKAADAPIQQEEWKQYTIESLAWKVDATKYVDSTSKHAFLAALIANAGVVAVTTPVLIGSAVYGDAETDSGAPKTEKMTYEGSGVFSPGAYWAGIVNEFLSYRTDLLTQQGVVPKPVVIVGAGSGVGLMTKAEWKSDGKRIKVDVSIQGSGQFTLS